MAGNEERGIDLLLKVKTDQQLLDASKKALKDFQKEFGEAAKNSEQLAQVERDLARDVIKQEQAVKASTRAFKDFNAAEIANAKSVKALDKEVKAASVSLEKYRAAKAAAANTPISDPTARELAGNFGRQRISPFLAQAGVTIRNQPAIATPLGVSTDAIAKLTALFGNLPPVALPVIGVLAALGAGFIALESSLQGSKKALDAATLANKAYYELIAEGAGSDEARKRVEELNRTMEAQREELATIENAFRGSVDSANPLISTLARLSSTDDELTKRADELRNSLRNNEAEVTRLNGALEAGAFAENDYAAAIERANKARAEGLVAGADQAISEFERIFKEGALSPSQIAERISAITTETMAIQRGIDVLKQSGDTSDEVAAKILEYELRLNSLGAEQSRLNALTATAAAREKALADAREAAQKRTDSIKAVERYNADLVKLEEQYGQARANAADKYLDAVTKASEAAAEAAADALRQLQQKREDLTRDLARDEEDAAIELAQEQLDAQIEHQQEEAESYQEHLQNLARIRRRGLLDEQTAIENRDAVALFAAREKTKNEIDEATQQFNQEREKRNRAYRQQLNDLGVAQQRDREARMRKYRRDLEDAQIAYTRDLQLSQQKYQADLQMAQQQYQREMALAQQKYQMELALRNSAIKAELDLIARGNAARLEMERQYWIQAQALRGMNVYPQPAPGVTTPGFLSQLPSYLQSNGGSTSPFARSTNTSNNVTLNINRSNGGRNAVIGEVTRQLNIYFDSYDRA